MDLNTLTLADLQPSQFYISERKLTAVERWFSPHDLANFEPIPVKLLDGCPVITDGHTRCVAAIRRGLLCLPLIAETEELDWELYRACVIECRIRGVDSPYRLTDRVISDQAYRQQWLGWCAQLQGIKNFHS